LCAFTAPSKNCADCMEYHHKQVKCVGTDGKDSYSSFPHLTLISVEEIKQLMQ
jgi:hypothetical protein